MTEVLYECDNPACPLGSAVQPGVFTGGATDSLKASITGEPLEKLVDGDDYGAGFCPNCGVQGTEIGIHELAAPAALNPIEPPPKDENPPPDPPEE